MVTQRHTRTKAWSRSFRPEPFLTVRPSLTINTPLLVFKWVIDDGHRYSASAEICGLDESNHARGSFDRSGTGQQHDIPRLDVPRPWSSQGPAKWRLRTSEQQHVDSLPSPASKVGWRCCRRPACRLSMSDPPTPCLGRWNAQRPARSSRLSSPRRLISGGFDPVNAGSITSLPRFTRPAIRRALLNPIDQRQATAHWTIGSAAAH
jgi:hypothetical protein